jgi:hypothetical protein
MAQDPTARGRMEPRLTPRLLPRLPGNSCSLRRWLQHVSLCCASAACLSVAIVHAQETAAPGAEPSNDAVARARQLFEGGVAHYDSGRYAEALAEFQEAYRLKPHPLVRVNIANCYDKLGRPVEAIENFEAFLAAAEGTPTQRDEVRGALRELQKRIGRVALNVAPPGARILVDEHDVGRAPLLDTLTLPSGRHRVSVSLDGYETTTRVVEIKAQETATVRIDLSALPVPESAAPEATEAATPADAPSAPAPTPPIAALPAPVKRTSNRHQVAAEVWIAGGATLALGVTAVVTGQLALAADREFDANLAAVRNPMLTEFQRAGAWARGVDAANRADALAVATDVLLAVTLVSAGLTTYFYLADRETTSDEATPTAKLSFGLGRVSLQGQF